MLWLCVLMQRLKELKADAAGAEQKFDGKVIKGTCQKLEKSYFRLTAPPDPSVVRPLPVLKSALAKLVASLHDGSAPYFYALDQFKGMRQYLTVQHIRDEVCAQASPFCPSRPICTPALRAHSSSC